MYIILLKLLMAAMAVYIALTPWGTLLTRSVGHIMILLSFFLPVVSLRTNGDYKVKATTLCVIGMGILIVSSLAYSATGFNFNLMRDIMSFLCMYWAIDVPAQTFSKRDLKHIFFINKLQSLLYIAYTFLPFSFRYSYMWNGYVFTLGMGNPNSTAIYVLASIMLLVLEIIQTDKRFLQLLLLIMVACLLYTAVLLQSRMVMGCAIGAVVLVFCKHIKLRKWYANVVILIPLVFIFLQSVLEAADEITIMGKPLASGRDNLYEGYLALLQNDPWSYILGRIGQHELQNFHNAHFAILMNIGVVGYAFYLLFWGTTLRAEISKSNRTKLQTAAIMCLFLYTIHSSAEAAPMLGNLQFGYPIIILSRLAKDSFV